MTRYKYLFVLIAVCFASTSQAQKTPFGTFTVGKSYLYPVGFMKESIGNGSGFNASAMFRIHKLPFQVGYTHSFNRHQFYQTPIDYSDNGINVQAIAEARSRSNVINLFIRKEFLFKNRPGFVPYIEAGGGSTLLNTNFRIFSERLHSGSSATLTTYTTSSSTTATANPDYDNCVPNDEDPAYFYTTTFNTTSYTMIQTGAVPIRTYYEIKDILKNNTCQAYVGTGLNLAVLFFDDIDSDVNFDDDNLNANMNFYEEARGLFLNVHVGYMFGGNLSYLSLNNPDPTHDHSIHSNESTKSYTVDFRNLRTNEIHAHQVGTVYTSPFRAFYIQLGLSIKI